MSSTPGSRVRRGGGGRALTGSPLRGKSFNNNHANTSNTEDSSSSSKTMSRLYQGLLQLRKFRNKAKDEPLPHHTKDNVHIQVPLRMMVSTLSIFLIFPLTLFGWRQFHPTLHVEIRNNSTKGLYNNNHDKFPTWMDEIQLPPLNETKNGTTSVESTLPPPENKPEAVGDSPVVAASQKTQESEEEERIEQDEEEVEETSE